MTLFDKNNKTAVAVQRTRMLADLLRSYVGLVPTWRVQYFDRGSGRKARSVLIVAENVLVGLEEVRARMAPTCARARVTKLDLDLATIFVLPATRNDMARVSDGRPRQNLKTDVLVVGGGAAGLAAACTAARAGARVLLLEKYGFCGGAAVAGLSGTVCGLYAATDNRSAAPEKVVFGFADRFLEVMKMKDGVTDPIRYGKTFTLTHDPLVWREAGGGNVRAAACKALLKLVALAIHGINGLRFRKRAAGGGAVQDH